MNFSMTGDLQIRRIDRDHLSQTLSKGEDFNSHYLIGTTAQI